jgi:hypothetical protein
MGYFTDHGVSGTRPAQDRDPRFPAMRRDQADELLRRLVAGFAARGISTTVGADGQITLANGALANPHNLSVRLASAPPNVWDAEIDRFMASMRFITGEEAQPELPLSEAREILLPRLLSADALPEMPGYTRPFSGDLRLVLTLDHPDTVQILWSVDHLGDWAALEPIALENLRRLPRPEPQRIADEDGTGVVFAFVTEDFFGATRVLILDDLLRDQAGVDPAGRGVVFAIPNRHVLAAHVMTGLDVMAAISTLSQIAAGQAGGAGPLTPQLFYRAPDGRIGQITQDRPDGIAVMAVGLFGEALASLGLIEPG